MYNISYEWSICDLAITGLVITTHLQAELPDIPMFELCTSALQISVADL